MLKYSTSDTCCDLWCVHCLERHAVSNNWRFS